MISHLLVHKHPLKRAGGIVGLWLILFASSLGITLGTVEAIGTTVQQAPASATVTTVVR